jgi:hypothetical protein
LKTVLLVLFIALNSLIFSQSLKGKVIDNQGSELPFAKIRIKNTSYGTVANAYGNYVLELKAGEYEVSVSAIGFEIHTEKITIHENFNTLDFVMKPAIQEIDEVVIVGKTTKERGKEIMKQVIDKRSYFYDLVSEFSCDTYCFTSLEKDKLDTIVKDSIIGKEKLNLSEWRALTSYKKPAKFKDEFYAFNDFSDANKAFSGGVSIGIQSGAEELVAPTIGQQSDPYMFVTSLKDAHINIFENLIEAPKLSQNPIVSPLAYNAFIYYNFYLESSFIDADSSFVYEIKVKPRFEQEALFDGTIFIRDEKWEVVSYQLGINPGALTYFKEIVLICDYKKIRERLVPTRREFVYNIKEGKTIINGLIRLNYADYKFEVADEKKNFWLETATYTDDAFDKDTSFWNSKRPFTLKDIEKKFIHQQDSIINYHESDSYLREMDSLRNEFKFLNLIFGQVGHVNSFKKYEFSVDGLIQQVVPFGVGGYRHRLNVHYSKEFKNGKAFSVNPYIDYGFLNKDVKGSFGGSFTYNPKRFAKISFNVGDVYDFVTNYQNIQGTFAPGNRVRNKKFEVSHRHEVFNGLYMNVNVLYSNRQSIDSLKYPSWISEFGMFAKPQSFEGYKILLTTLDFEYHFKQKYIIRKNKKIVLGSPWPVLNLQYKKGLPNVFSTQADFDYLELRANDEITLNTLGVSELKFISGMFLRKKDLRLIENRFFRTSDRYFFSNPTNSLQLLDTALNTSNSFMQFNYIHHFKGFFLNKVWLINKLKLEETIGGGFLIIPDAKFAQVEFYAGLERKFRIRKEVFKIGIYAVTADNTFEKANINFKVGVNFFNSFTQKWDY